jgi:hypothetical protein
VCIMWGVRVQACVGARRSFDAQLPQGRLQVLPQNTHSVHYVRGVRVQACVGARRSFDARLPQGRLQVLWVVRMDGVRVPRCVRVSAQRSAHTHT